MGQVSKAPKGAARLDGKWWSKTDEGQQKLLEKEPGTPAGLELRKVQDSG